jgi:hypothetical protein
MQNTFSDVGNTFWSSCYFIENTNYFLFFFHSHYPHYVHFVQFFFLIWGLKFLRESISLLGEKLIIYMGLHKFEIK